MANKTNGALNILGPPLASGLGPSPAILTRTASMSYNELDRQASRFAGFCSSLGLAPQSRIVLLMHDHCEFVSVYLGAMKAGLVPVALNVRLSAADLRFIIKDSDAGLVVLDDVFLPLFEEACAVSGTRPPVIVRHSGKTPAARQRDYPDLETETKQQSPVFEAIMMHPDDMVLWMYSSGTTGRPKAVVHLQKSIETADRYFGPVYDIGPGSRIFCTSKLFFAFTLGHCLLAGLKLGAAIILFDGWPSPQAVCQIAAELKPSVMLSVPGMYRAILNEGLGAAECFSSVRLFIAAGERLPGATYDDWHGATGRKICEGIGATETLTMFLGNYPGHSAPGISGALFPQTKARLLDDAGNEIKTAGKPGILWVRMPGIAASYWNNEEMSRRVFNDGWYCTGDMFTRDDEGHYSHTGRADDMLKISGQWVSPIEIETQVLQNPHISEAAVIGVRNKDNFTRLVLCLTLKKNAPKRQKLEENLLRQLKKTLSIYKCPRRFIYIDEMPCTASGKLQRFKLREIAARELGMKAM